METKVYAHRGVSSLAPENTMPAFKKALEYKADGIELDVQLSKDGVPVVIHDETLERTTTGSGMVKDHTVTELKKLDAGKWFSPAYWHTAIPTFEEFAGWVAETPLNINVELKTNKVRYEGIEQKVLDILKKYGLTERSVISAFNYDSLKTVREIDPDMSFAPLSSKRLAKPCEFADSIGADSIHLNYRLINRRLLKHCSKNGIILRTYTVNSVFAMRKCFKMKIPAIITDMPHKAIMLKSK